MLVCMYASMQELNAFFYANLNDVYVYACV